MDRIIAPKVKVVSVDGQNYQIRESTSIELTPGAVCSPSELFQKAREAGIIIETMNEKQASVLLG